jgi:hypothetical protein
VPTLRTKFGSGSISIPDGQEYVAIRLKSANKIIYVPIDIATSVDELGLRQYAFQSGQVESQEAAGLPGEHSPVDKGGMSASGYYQGTSPTAAALIGAGRRMDRMGAQFGQLMGKEGAVEREQEIDRLSTPIRQSNPASSFVGESILPELAVPGGKLMQGAAGLTEGVLSGDTPGQRASLGLLGLLLGIGGAKLGEMGGQRTREGVQTLMGDADVAARSAVRNAGVPLSLSQQLSRPGQGMRSVFGGSLSRPMVRFFERAKFTLTGNQPLGPKQQAEISKALSEVFGISSTRYPRFTREALGAADRNITPVFRNAARQAAVESGGRVQFDNAAQQVADEILRAMQKTGSDSNVARTTITNAVNDIKSGQMLPDDLLRLRSSLSEATTLDTAGPNIRQLVGLIDVIDDSLMHQAPHIADDLITARERFRLMLALRRGSALAPDGSLNVPTFTKNLERVFNNFDIGAPLPGSLRETGEAIAGFNQLLDPFRSSGTAENLMAAGGDAGILRKVLAPLASVSGGGTGALLGGGFARSLLAPHSPLDTVLSQRPFEGESL